jgi:PST family polysaccharide transporter
LPLKRKDFDFFGENKACAGLGRESLYSGIAFVAARAFNMLVQIATTILVARLLSPRDYGLVAIVLALVAFAPTLIDLGTTDAVVQRKRITHADMSTLFWLKLSIAGVLALLLVGGSGFLASAYGEPALTGIALVSSLMFVIVALSAQHVALMRRAMQFKRMAAIEIFSNVISSIIAVAMAFTGWGYWGLVAKPIVNSGLSMLGAWMSCRWLPGRPRITPEVKKLVSFGLGVTGFTMTDYLAQSADPVLIGYLFGPVLLGYFQNALLIYSNLLILLGQFHEVAVSSLSKLRSNLDELKRSWASALSALSFFSMLAFSGLAVTGQDLVLMLLGQKWAAAGPLLCIFAVRGIAHVAERSLGWLHVAAGRSDRWMRWGLFSAVVQIIGLLAGIPFGLLGIATAHAIASFCLFVPGLTYAGRPVGIGVKDVLQVVGPQTVAALATVAIGFTAQRVFMNSYNEIARFALSVPICLTVYLTVAIGVFRRTRPLQLALLLLRERFR